MKVIYCACVAGRPHPEQLLENGFWPATWKEPRTAITLRTMHAYDNLKQVAQVNVYDYVAFLKKMTDGVRTEDVNVGDLPLPPVRSC